MLLIKISGMFIPLEIKTSNRLGSETLFEEDWDFYFSIRGTFTSKVFLSRELLVLNELSRINLDFADYSSLAGLLVVSTLSSFLTGSGS